MQVVIGVGLNIRQVILEGGAWLSLVHSLLVDGCRV